MKRFLEPKRFVQGWRLLQISLLFHVWVIGEASAGSFVLILLLLLFACLRWRFRLPAWTALCDALACFLYAPYSAIGFWGLALPVFELTLKGRWLLALPFFISLFFAPFPTDGLFWNLTLALFAGGFSYTALYNQHIYKQEADEQRKARYELERLKTELLEANEAAVRQAEQMERYRIARKLHDNLGHDLTGAALALQAYDYVDDPEEARSLLQEVKRRLDRGTASLRETVHNTTPAARLGAEQLENIAAAFGAAAEVRFQASGDMQSVPAYYWTLLEACLKEGLTNAARHSNASRIEVSLQAAETIVRLMIRDNGSIRTSAQTEGAPGSGLRHLQTRARALGGSLTYGRSAGFVLVCVLPLRQKEGAE